MALITTQIAGTDTIDQGRIATNAIIAEAISATNPADQGIPLLAAGQCTTVISANATALVGFHYFVDTAGCTLTLPVAPTQGQQVKVTVGNFVDTVIDKNGSNIVGVFDDLTVDVANMGLTLIFTNATRGWVVL